MDCVYIMKVSTILHCKQFESMIQRDTGNYLLKNYIGIVYLRLGNYEKALQYFKQFENDTLYC